MGAVFRAALGFAIAFALYAPNTFLSYVPVKALTRVDAEIAAAHPEAKLAAQIQDLRRRAHEAD